MATNYCRLHSAAIYERKGYSRIKWLTTSISSNRNHSSLQPQSRLLSHPRRPLHRLERLIEEVFMEYRSNQHPSCRLSIKDQERHLRASSFPYGGHESWQFALIVYRQAMPNSIWVSATYADWQIFQFGGDEFCVSCIVRTQWTKTTLR